MTSHGSEKVKSCPTNGSGFEFKVCFLQGGKDTQFWNHSIIFSEFPNETCSLVDQNVDVHLGSLPDETFNRVITVA